MKQDIALKENQEYLVEYYIKTTNITSSDRGAVFSIQYVDSSNTMKWTLNTKSHS